MQNTEKNTKIIPMDLNIYSLPDEIPVVIHCKHRYFIKNSVILPDAYISENIFVENHVVGKHSRLIHCKELVADSENPGYVRRGDTL